MELEKDLKEMTIDEIAFLIKEDWKNVSPYAEQYLSAMTSLTKITDKFYYDSGYSVVAYFLANAGSYRGEVAREVKKELNRRMK